jgi:Tfp pilus assembly protein PilF
MQHAFRWMCILAFVTPLVVFTPSVARSDFVSIDDTLLITQNATVQHLSPRSVFRAFSSYDPELYVPLTLLTYQVEHAVFGLNPVVFHFTNLLLHAGSSLLLFLLARKILGADLPALLVALLFAVHPLNAEAVAWAAARKDVLSTMFFLLSLLLYEQSEQSRDARMRAWSIVTFLAALLSKVTVLTLPVVLVLLDWRAGRPVTLKSIREKWPWFCLSALFACIAIGGKTRNLASLSLFDHLLIGMKGIAWYLQKFFWPASLSVAYPQETAVSLARSEFFVPAILATALLVTAWMLRRYRTVSFGILFFLVTVSANFFNVWKNGMLFFASDRYAYVAAIGIAVAGVWLLFRWTKAAAPFLGFAAVAALSVLCLAQARVWASSETLYRHALDVAPRSLMILNNLGDTLVRSGREEEGLQYFLRAVDADPKNVLALTNAGNIFKKRGKFAEAEEFYRRAADAAPQSPQVEQLLGLYLLGELLLEQGKTDQGFLQLKKATELGAAYAEPFFNYGLMLERYGRKAEAVEAFSGAVNVDGTYLAARYHLAALLSERGKLPQARQQLAAIVAIDPAYEKAAAHLAQIDKLLTQ